MPFVEISTSQKDLSYDSDGYAYLTRTFKVWGVDPKSFFGNPGNIAAHTGGQPMPDYGNVLQLLDGPDGVVSPARETRLFLYKYTLAPESHEVFIATAHYSNDNRLSPYTTGVSGNSSFGWVDIPYVRRFPTIDIGNATQSQDSGFKVALVEGIYRARMQQSRMTQRVAIPRQQWLESVKVAEREAGTIHKIEGQYYLFEGHTVADRGPQIVDITYTWMWESGIETLAVEEKNYDKDRRTADVSDDLKPIYPPKVSPLVSLGADDQYIVPPYHTIELLYTTEVNANNIALTKPYWKYRMPYEVSEDGARGLPGSSDFDWGDV